MHRLRKYIISGLFVAALSIPLGMIAKAAVPQDQTYEGAKKQEKAAKADKKAAKADKDARVYDAKHNTYHDWTTQEDASYRAYLEQQHMQYRAYQELNAQQQASYWDWRADHPGVPAPAAPPPPAY